MEVARTLSVSKKKSWEILFAVGLGTIMLHINASIVNVSLLTISGFFNAPIITSEWVLTSYLITLLAFVLFLVDLVISGVMNDFTSQDWLDLSSRPLYVV